jgi:hypothetical protein
VKPGAKKAYEMKTLSDLNEKEMDLLYEAVTLADPAKRGAFLDQACAGNSNLRTRMEEVLVIYAEAEKFFASADLATCLKADDVQTAPLPPAFENRVVADGCSSAQPQRYASRDECFPASQPIAFPRRGGE